MHLSIKFYCDLFIRLLDRGRSTEKGASEPDRGRPTVFGVFALILLTFGLHRRPTVSFTVSRPPTRYILPGPAVLRRYGDVCARA